MRRTLVAVTLASSLLSLPSGRFLQPLWNLVSSLWASPAQAGCGVDPSGRCMPAATQPQLDEGCGVDPSGRCQSQVDGGCGMDPNGRCNPGS
ncbi:MAG TPA: hypothetical protein VGS07_23865 [Thermoanaerobaculia bacterium]|jgi:hypothetical protein|nr:hypothetical protein [Thermoanaerobaculia bacterium]